MRSNGQRTASEPDFRSHEESALIKLARASDCEAFAMLFRVHRPRIFGLASCYYAPGSDRDDLIQEATIGFFKAVRDFRRDRGSFAAFVDLCVRRQLITFIKTATRQKHTVLNRAASLDAPLFDDSDETLIARIPAKQPHFGYVDSDNIEFLKELQQRCSGLERGVLSMYSNGYGFEEMAQELRVHLKSIDNAVWRVKVKAKKLLAQMPVSLS